MGKSFRGAERRDRLTPCNGVQTYRSTTAPFVYSADSNGLRVLVGPVDLLRFNKRGGRRRLQTCGNLFHMRCMGRPYHLGYTPRTLWYRTNKQTGEQTPCPEECVEAHMRSLLCAECLEEACPSAATDFEQLPEGEPRPSTAARLCFTQCTRQCIITTDAFETCHPDLSIIEVCLQALQETRVCCTMGCATTSTCRNCAST